MEFSPNPDIVFPTLKNIYYAIFSSHLIYSILYGSQIWGQNINITYIDKISIIRRMQYTCIITFAQFNAHTDPIFKK